MELVVLTVCAPLQNDFKDFMVFLKDFLDFKFFFGFFRGFVFDLWGVIDLNLLFF